MLTPTLLLLSNPDWPEATVRAAATHPLTHAAKSSLTLIPRLAPAVDGDTFTLVWDPDLLIVQNEPPSNYTAPTQPRLVKQVELKHIKEVRRAAGRLAKLWAR
jgi:hypothetical protein